MVALSQLRPGQSRSSDLASGHHLPRSVSEGGFNLCCLLTARLGLGKFSHTVFGVRFPAVILLQGRPEEAESGSRGLVTSLVTLPAAYCFILLGPGGC